MRLATRNVIVKYTLDIEAEEAAALLQEINDVRATRNVGDFPTLDKLRDLLHQQLGGD